MLRWSSYCKKNWREGSLCTKSVVEMRGMCRAFVPTTHVPLTSNKTWPCSSSAPASKTNRNQLKWGKLLFDLCLSTQIAINGTQMALGIKGRHNTIIYIYPSRCYTPKAKTGYNSWTLFPFLVGWTIAEVGRRGEQMRGWRFYNIIETVW